MCECATFFKPIVWRGNTKRKQMRMTFVSSGNCSKQVSFRYSWFLVCTLKKSDSHCEKVIFTDQKRDLSRICLVGELFES